MSVIFYYNFFVTISGISVLTYGCSSRAREFTTTIFSIHPPMQNVPSPNSWYRSKAEAIEDVEREICCVKVQPNQSLQRVVDKMKAIQVQRT